MINFKRPKFYLEVLIFFKEFRCEIDGVTLMLSLAESLKYFHIQF